MTFNELNSVEHFIIYRLTDVSLNNVYDGMVAEEAVEYGNGVNRECRLGSRQRGICKMAER